MCESILLVVLNDGETFSDMAGCHIVATRLDELEEAMNEGDEKGLFENCESLPIGPITDVHKILKWMRVFFPDMQVEEDLDGQVLLYTGIYDK